MEHKFYPSLLGRIFFFFASLCSAFVFVYLCVISIYDYGITFAADGVVFGEVCVLLIITSVALIAGLISFHFMSLTISPFPSMIISDTGILYKNMGSVGYEHIGWHGMRFGKRKGLFKYLYMQLLIPKRVELNQNQNFIYKITLRLLKTIYRIITFSFTRWLTSKPNNKKNFHTIHIYRATIGVPLSKIEKLLDEKIDFFAPKIQVPANKQTKEHTPAVVRTNSKESLKSIGKVLSMASIALIIIFPFSMIGLGSYKYNRDLRNDPTTQQTQALRELALSGDADAQNKFGWRLSNGVGIPKSNRRANRWYLLAAKQGHTKAQYNVGLSYKCKRKKKSNCKKAAKWFRKAVNGGLHQAQPKLAYLYYKGWGVQKSYINAFRLFKLAAKKNDAYSLYFLGFMYEKGRGVEQSKDKAIHYYQEALKYGYPKAKKPLNRLAS